MNDYQMRVVTALSEDLAFSLDAPWRTLPERARDALLFGRDYRVHVKYRNRFGRERSYTCLLYTSRCV